MTWATVIDVAMRLKGRPETIRQIIDEAKQVFECEIEYDEPMDTFFLYNLSWTSHVSKERIDKFIRKYKRNIAEFKGDLYFLTAPHAKWNIENN